MRVLPLPTLFIPSERITGTKKGYKYESPNRRAELTGFVEVPKNSVKTFIFITLSVNSL